ncbi:MAG: class I SAM-dependent methyltransferase [Candidatus Scalindua sp.]|nr:class I SAM-dependent methyltransferase [Candidatus Scalindua sp.]
MKNKRYRIQFPKSDCQNTDQDESFFYLIEPNGKKKIRFHDYDAIFNIPGLYEQIFYDRLKCNSPKKVAEILHSSVAQSHENFTELRVLDLGAGNGIMGAEFKKYSVSRLVGVDIIPEAKRATERDRPDIYDAYHVVDFCNLSDDEREDLSSWSLNCFTTVAALGFGDIPPRAFMEAFNIIQSEGWVAFNIKETFLDNSDSSGFSRMIRDLIFSEFLHLYHLERYRHRLSIEGEPLYYFAIAGRKNFDIPSDFYDKYFD